MGLIKCPECGKEISDSINQCIHCVYILKKESSNNQQKGNGKIIIHGYSGIYAVNPPVKIYDKDKFVGEVKKEQTFEYYITEDTTLVFKCSIRSCKVFVSSNVNTEIKLMFDNFSGALKAITNIQGSDKENNIISTQKYQEQINNSKSKNLTWLIIAIVILILVLIFL